MRDEQKIADLRKAAMGLPLTPGVYIMKNAAGEIIYIGKAKALKNRVSQYFAKTHHHAPKVEKMVENVDRFDYVLVDSEFEALILEASLIKQHKPKYNILLKDDKGYPFIRLDLKEQYPRFALANRIKDDGARYFGPFGGRSASFDIIRTVNKALLLPTCTRRFPRDIGKERPCLNYQMGLCAGYCRPEADPAAYRAAVEQAAMVLAGKSGELREIGRAHV